MINRIENYPSECYDVGYHNLSNTAHAHQLFSNTLASIIGNVLWGARHYQTFDDFGDSIEEDLRK